MSNTQARGAAGKEGHADKNRGGRGHAARRCTTTRHTLTRETHRPGTFRFGVSRLLPERAKKRRGGEKTARCRPGVGSTSPGLSKAFVCPQPLPDDVVVGQLSTTRTPTKRERPKQRTATKRGRPERTTQQQKIHRQPKRQNQSTERTFSSSSRRRRRTLLSLLPLLFFPPPPGLRPLRLLALLPRVLRGQSGLAPRLEEDVVVVDRVFIRKKREGRVRLLLQPQQNFQLTVATRPSAIGGGGGGRMSTLTSVPNVRLRTARKLRATSYLSRVAPCTL